MEADEEELFVVIIGDVDMQLSAEETFHIKTEVEQYDEVSELLEKAESHGEFLEVDLSTEFKSEPEDGDNEASTECRDVEKSDNDDDENDEDYVVDEDNKNDSEDDESDEDYICDKEKDQMKEVRKRGRKIQNGNKEVKAGRWRLKSSEFKSYVKELKKQHPEFGTDEEKLVHHLAEVMKALKPPLPPSHGFTVHDSLYECAECDKLITSKLPVLYRHYQDHHGPRYLVCYACGADFRSKTNLYKHEKRCLAPDRRIVLRARALMVGRKGTRKGTRRPYLPAYIEPAKKDSKRFMCDECPAVFTTKCSLISHQNLHRGERPHRCRDCGAAYTSSSALLRHYGSKHSDNKYVCEQCGAVFSFKHALASHMNTHLPEKQFPCTYEGCGRRFSNKMHLNIHIDRVHKKLLPAFACQVCPRRYPRMSLLKVHMKKAHGLTIMTRTMLLKKLPKLSDMQAQDAMLVFKMAEAKGKHDGANALQEDEGDAWHEEMELQEDTGEFLPVRRKIQREAAGSKKVNSETTGSGGHPDIAMKEYVDAVLKVKCEELVRETKAAVIENGKGKRKEEKKGQLMHKSARRRLREAVLKEFEG